MPNVTITVVPQSSVKQVEAIKEATLFCQPRTAVELSQITHERSRSWIEGKDGDLLDIYIDTIPDEEYESRKARIARLDGQLTKILEETGA